MMDTPSFTYPANSCFRGESEKLPLAVLKQYLAETQATVLANQFMYYAQGYPKLRVAPDVMVIFDVTPGGRDNYKIWEEGQVPSVIFEMTSSGTNTNSM